MAKGIFILLGSRHLYSLRGCVLALSLLAVSVLNITQANAANRIIGGEELSLVKTEANYPWMVLLANTFVVGRWSINAGSCLLRIVLMGSPQRIFLFSWEITISLVLKKLNSV